MALQRLPALIVLLVACLLVSFPAALSAAQDNMTMFYTSTTATTNGSSIVMLAWREGPVMTGWVQPLQFPSGDHQPMALAFDEAEQRVYWSDFASKMIHSYNRSLGDGRKLYQLNSEATAYGLAVDSRARLLFYADDANKVIAIVTLKGGYYRTVLSNTLSDPRGLDLDTSNGIVYYSDVGERPKIASVRYDGTDPAIHVSIDIKSPVTLTFSPDEGLLYWCDSDLKRVESIHVTGSARRRVLRQGAVFHFMDVSHGHLYFSSPQQGGIWRMTLDGQSVSLFHNTSGRIHDLCVLDNNETRGPVDAEGCGCSHICIPSGGGQWKCLCPDGLILQPDKQTCTLAPDVDHFLLLADFKRHQLFRVALETGAHYPLHVDALAPSGLDVDVLERRLYWTDLGRRTLQTARLDGSDVRTVRQLDGNAIPGRLRVDARAGLLFYTDSGLDLLAVMALNGSQHRALVDRGLDKPNGLALDFQKRHVYFTDRGQRPRIERVQYDGTQPVTLVSIDLRLPTGLALDSPGHRLYWCDAGLDRIESINLDGSNRRVLLEKSYTTFGSLALYKGFIYIADLNNTGIQRVRAEDGSSPVTFGIPDYSQPRDVVVFDSQALALPTTPVASTPGPATPAPGTPAPSTPPGAAALSVIVGAAVGGAVILILAIIIVIVVVAVRRRKQMAKKWRSQSVGYATSPSSDYAHLYESRASGGSASGICSILQPGQQNGGFQAERLEGSLHLSAGRLEAPLPQPDYLQCLGHGQEGEREGNVYDTLPGDTPPPAHRAAPPSCKDDYLHPVFPPSTGPPGLRDNSP